MSGGYFVLGFLKVYCTGAGTCFLTAPIHRNERNRMTRDKAWDLLNEYTKSDSLLKHALAVEAAMRHYAAHFGERVESWGVTGLIHDFDYERWPNPPQHTREGAKILRARGVAEEIIGAILSHATWNWGE